MPVFGPLSSIPLASVGTNFVVAGNLPTPLRLNAIVSASFIASGGTAPYTYSATGLPTGLSINASTGVVSGTATTVGTYSSVVTATDSTSPTPLTASTPTMTVVVIALPAFNYDFPNPRGHPWPSDVRTGWTWPSQVPLQSAGANIKASKFIAYAVIIPQPFNVRRVYENPLPIPPNKWAFIRRWESGPPFPLRETPYHPFGAQVFPDRLTRRPRAVQDWVQPTNFLPVYEPPVGVANFPHRLTRQNRPELHTVAQPSRGLVRSSRYGQYLLGAL